MIVYAHAFKFLFDVKRTCCSFFLKEGIPSFRKQFQLLCHTTQSNKTMKEFKNPDTQQKDLFSVDSSRYRK